MKNQLFALLAPAVAVFLTTADAHALGLDVTCDASDEACSPMELNPAADGAWNVEFGGGDSKSAGTEVATFGKDGRGQRVNWWRWRFWRLWPRNPGPKPIEDPIAPTPDPVPEPGTLGLLGLGGAYVVTRMRKRRSA